MDPKGSSYSGLRQDLDSFAELLFLVSNRMRTPVTGNDKFFIFSDTVPCSGPYDFGVAGEMAESIAMWR